MSSFPFDPHHGLIVIPTRLEGPSGDVLVRLALDTGATRSIVSGSRLLLIGYDPEKASERIPVTTGSGTERAPRLAVAKVEALGQERYSFLVLSHTLPPSAMVDGVLGLDFLRGCRVVIDFRAGLVTLE
jgi:aspartyl protease family protein